MIAYYLLAGVKEKPTKVLGKQEKYLKMHRTTKSRMVPKTQEIVNGPYGDATRTIRVTKAKNVETLNWLNMTEPATEKDFSSTWEYHPMMHSGVNYSHYNARMKSVDDDDRIGYKHDPSFVAKLMHSATPRVDLFFQRVDNQFSFSSEYQYVSMHIYGYLKHATLQYFI